MHVVIALVAVLSCGLVGPAVAAMTQAEMDAMKAEIAASGKTDEERMAYWKTMKPDRQAAWKAECNSGEIASMSESEKENRGDRFAIRFRNQRRCRWLTVEIR